MWHGIVLVLFMLRACPGVSSHPLTEMIAQNTAAIHRICSLPSSGADVVHDSANAHAMSHRARATGAFIEMLADSDACLRYKAAYDLERHPDGRATSALLRALSDRNQAVRWQAARSLAAMPSPYAVSGLVQALRDPMPDVRAEVVRALAVTDRQDVLVPLMHVMEHDSVSAVRANAAFCIGKLGNRWAVPELIDALYDGSRNVRWAAATSLGTLGDERARKPLKEVIRDDTQEQVRLAARLALSRLDIANTRTHR